jgi:hypothetical protein
VSPTLFRHGRYRFFFFSKEESRVHVHVLSSDGDAKIWLEPRIELAHATGVSAHEVKLLIKIIKGRSDEIKKEWRRHFGR